MRLTGINCLAACTVLLSAMNASAGETTSTTTTESYAETRAGIPRFTLDQAILTALQRNPSIMRAREDIERTKGLYIQMRAAILPRLGADVQFQDEDPHLQSLGRFTQDGGYPYSGRHAGSPRQVSATSSAVTVCSCR